MMKDDYKKIFWKTGLEITPDTFIQADNYSCAQQNLIRRLINLQYYGLLPVDETGVSSLIVDATISGTEVTIDQLFCQGITKDGYLIDFRKNQICSVDTNQLLIPGKTARAYYVVVRIKPFEYMLVEPVENEETPFALPVYELDIKELSQIEGHELAILKIDNSQQSPKIYRDYIPPCMALRSYEGLIDYYREIKQVIANILSTISAKKTPYRELIYPFTFLLFDLEQFSPNNPPYHLIQQLKKMVKTIEVYFISFEKKFKEGESTSFSYEESDALVRAYNNSQLNLSEVLNTPYNHNDIVIVLSSLAKCFKDIQQFFGKKEVKIEEDSTPRI